MTNKHKKITSQLKVYNISCGNIWFFIFFMLMLCTLSMVLRMFCTCSYPESRLAHRVSLQAGCPPYLKLSVLYIKCIVLMFMKMVKPCNFLLIPICGLTI